MVRPASLRLFQQVDGPAHGGPEPSDRLGQCGGSTLRVNSQRGQSRIVMAMIDRDTARGRDQGHIVTGGHSKQRIDWQ